MRSLLAHVLRWSARWQLAVSNRLLPPYEVTEDDFAEFTQESGFTTSWADDDRGHMAGTLPAPLTVTYTGGPEGPAARKVRLQGMDDSVWDLAGPPAREEC
ncbi:hypothetical protein [Nocardia aurea]|uniref:hypothetical protein n=1 Tax=Nocardia aurea TaxID=2144174 RepID=UPI0033A33CB2